MLSTALLPRAAFQEERAQRASTSAMRGAVRRGRRVDLQHWASPMYDHSRAAAGRKLAPLRADPYLVERAKANRVPRPKCLRVSAFAQLLVAACRSCHWSVALAG